MNTNIKNFEESELDQKFIRHYIQMREAQKRYYDKKKESIKERMKLYNDKNKERIKENHKIYYQKNKEKLNEQRKEWYHKTKTEQLLVDIKIE